MILLLTMALMIIFAAAIVPTITFQIQRDREEEMIHRGVEYARAVKKYYKRFGRFPAKIEDLESTNNMRFLRKRYKDPITGQDFKFLRIGEVRLIFGGGAGAPVQVGSPGVPIVVPPQNPASGGTTANPTTNQTQTDSNQSQTPSSTTGTSTPSGQSDNSSGSSNGSDSGSFGGQTSAQVFGGMPIVGVASTSKKDTIREFNHKKKYNEWQFIYDPGLDRGGLLMTPSQPPPIQPTQNLNGQNGTNGSNPGFGNAGPGVTNPNPSGNGQPGSNDSNNPPQQQ